jgi:hypothetical protein
VIPLAGEQAEFASRSCVLVRNPGTPAQSEVAFQGGYLELRLAPLETFVLFSDSGDEKKILLGGIV